jgi:phosphatidylglycerophosphatase A
LKTFEKLPGGWGITADDLGAAVYTAAALWAMRLLA